MIIDKPDARAPVQRLLGICFRHSGLGFAERFLSEIFKLISISIYPLGCVRSGTTAVRLESLIDVYWPWLLIRRSTKDYLAKFATGHLSATWVQRGLGAILV